MDPRGGSSTTVSRSNWNLEMLVFEERGKPEYPGKSLSEQGQEPTTNSTHIWRRVRELNLGHIGGRRALLPLRHPCSPKQLDKYLPVSISFRYPLCSLFPTQKKAFWRKLYFFLVTWEIKIYYCLTVFLQR